MYWEADALNNPLLRLLYLSICTIFEFCFQTPWPLLLFFLDAVIHHLDDVLPVDLILLFSYYFCLPHQVQHGQLVGAKDPRNRVLSAKAGRRPAAGMETKTTRSVISNKKERDNSIVAMREAERQRGKKKNNRLRFFLCTSIFSFPWRLFSFLCASPRRCCSPGVVPPNLTICSVGHVFEPQASAFTASLIGAVSKHGGTRKVDSQGEAGAPAAPAPAPAAAPVPPPAADGGDEDSV